jgi:uncharacterized protein (TIGR00290 family)
MTGSRPRAAISWSGGKDSCAALARALASFDVGAMLTMFDDEETRSRSHGLRPELIQAQAERLGLRRVAGRGSWATYDAGFGAALDVLRRDGITHVVFGDIVYEEHRRWAEEICRAHGLVAVEPLFGVPTAALFDEWTAWGGDALIVTTRAAWLDESWLGRTLANGMRAEFEALGVDPCGERGEYHTLVVNCPLFSSPLRVTTGERVRTGDCWALDVALTDAPASRPPVHDGRQ